MIQDVTKEKLRKIRNDLGYTLKEFGELLGYHWTSVHRAETGKHSISQRYVLTLEKFLKERDCGNKRKLGASKKI